MPPSVFSFQLSRTHLPCMIVMLLALGAFPCATQAQAQPVPATSGRPTAAQAAPDDAPRLHWDPQWPRFRPIGYALTSASVLAALGVTFLIDYPSEPNWSGGILFDDAVRDGIRARNPGLRDAARTASHITLAATIVQVALVDSVILPLSDGSSDVALQLTLMNAQAFALNTLIATVLFKLVDRARPLIADCTRDPNFDPLCDSGAYASFPSSHTSTAFTAAGLTCAHHAYLPLYGSAGADMAACASALAVATATGVLRIVGDRHYATDVLVGAAIGLSLGYIYPWLMHYRYGDAARAQRTQSAASWTLLPAAPYGVSMMGAF